MPDVGGIWTAEGPGIDYLCDFFIKHTLYREVVARKALLHTGADKLLRSFTHMTEIV
jgi:hypothetical protein